MAQEVHATQVWGSELSPQQPWKTLGINENLQSACWVWETQEILELATNLVGMGWTPGSGRDPISRAKEGRHTRLAQWFHLLVKTPVPRGQHSKFSSVSGFLGWLLTVFHWNLEKSVKSGSSNSEAYAVTNHTGWENSYLFLLLPTPSMAYQIKDVQLTSVALTGICKHLPFHNKGMKSTGLQQWISCHQSAFVHKSQTANIYCACIMCKLNSFQKLRSLLYLNT